MDNFEIITLIVCVVFAVIGYFVVPYLKTATDNANWDKWKKVALTAVNCAEMVLDNGKSKKEWAVNFLDGIINKNKQYLTADQISALVEAAVMELHIAEK